VLYLYGSDSKLNRGNSKRRRRKIERTHKWKPRNKLRSQQIPNEYRIHEAFEHTTKSFTLIYRLKHEEWCKEATTDLNTVGSSEIRTNETRSRADNFERIGAYPTH